MRWAGSSGDVLEAQGMSCAGSSGDKMCRELGDVKRKVLVKAAERATEEWMRRHKRHRRYPEDLYEEKCSTCACTPKSIILSCSM